MSISYDELIKLTKKGRSKESKSTTKKISPKNFLKARDAAIDSIINEDTEPLNCKGSYKYNKVSAYDKIKNSAEKGFTSSIIYQWESSNITDGKWIFNDCKLIHLVLNNPSDDEGFKDNLNLVDKLKQHFDKIFGKDNLKVIFFKLKKGKKTLYTLKVFWTIKKSEGDSDSDSESSSESE